MFRICLLRLRVVKRLGGTVMSVTVMSVTIMSVTVMSVTVMFLSACVSLLYLNCIHCITVH